MLQCHAVSVSCLWRAITTVYNWINRGQGFSLGKYHDAILCPPPHSSFISSPTSAKMAATVKASHFVKVRLGTCMHNSRIRISRYYEYNDCVYNIRYTKDTTDDTTYIASYIDIATYNELLHFSLCNTASACTGWYITRLSVDTLVSQSSCLSVWLLHLLCINAKQHTLKYNE